MSSKPLVSVIMPTTRRPRFLAQAVRYYQRQTFEKRELVIVANGPEADVSMVPESGSIRIVRLEKEISIGQARNIGVENAAGAVIAMFDDDDWYAPEWLQACMTRIGSAPDPNMALVTMWRILVLLTWNGQLLLSEPGTAWCQGGTYAFSRRLWERRPYRAVKLDEDTAFFKDHRFWYMPVEKPELLVYLRHNQGHGGRMTHDHYMKRCEPSGLSLKQIMPSEDAAFYRSLEEVTA